MAISQAFKQTLVGQYGKDTKDTGSTEVQIAILTAEINALTNHIVANKKDYSSKRGLYSKVSRRRSLLEYLKSKDIQKYRDLIKKLELRN